MEAAHPITVHLPLALTFIAPIIMLLVIVGVSAGLWPKSVWLVPVIIVAGAFGGVYYAQQEGGRDADHVIQTYGKDAFGDPIHNHAHWSDYLFWTQAGTLALAVIALCVPPLGMLRILAFLFALGAWVPMYYTGHLGGELVYKLGASNAFDGPKNMLEDLTKKLPKNFNNPSFEEDHDGDHSHLDSSSSQP